jgi:hypothetical protein
MLLTVPATGLTTTKVTREVPLTLLGRADEVIE